jgi:hypothetical protein
MAISLVQKKTKTNSLERSKDCRLVFFSSAAASATAPSAPILLSDGGSGSARIRSIVQDKKHSQLVTNHKHLYI